MRQSTTLFLLLLIVLFAVFGLAFLKFVAIAVGLFLLLLFGSLFVGALLLRRRMRRKMQELQQAVQRAQADAQARREHESRKRDAIDVDATVQDDRPGSDPGT